MLGRTIGRNVPHDMVLKYVDICYLYLRADLAKQETIFGKAMQTVWRAKRPKPNVIMDGC